MLNVQAEISEVLCAFIGAALPGVLAHITARTDHGELAAPLEHAFGASAEACAKLLREKNAKEPAVYRGAPLIKEISTSGGYVCFSITDDAFSVVMRHIIKSCPLPALPDDAETEADYALCRMIMLSRKPMGTIPDNESIRAAMWSCFSIAAAQNGRIETAKNNAARRLLHMLDGISASERDKMQLGEIGACAARLLAIHPISEEKIS